MVYEFPCGSVDADESAEEAAIRELREETGLQNVRHVETFHYTNESGMQIAFVVLNGSDKEEPQETNPARKQTFYWFAFNEIPIAEFMPADREFAQKDLKACLHKSLRQPHEISDEAIKKN
ncbi:MAG: hypothetical protein A2W80_18320 [Candidatus Riflebacteria bacterium GWC2_50_8]|nr:MAG: hypothetical protein A2W80_18320 [Candidatus Riflebacteria bacterium GWC2_50_8]